MTARPRTHLNIVLIITTDEQRGDCLGIVAIMALAALTGWTA